MSNKLKSKIILKYSSLSAFAKDTGISRDTLSKKIHGSAKITTDDINFFKEKLDLSQEETIEIFFPEWLQNMQQK